MDSPASFARSIAELPTRAAREERLAAVGPAFRQLVAQLVAYMLAGQICGMSSRDARKAAVLEVPREIVDQVCSLVSMRFQTRAELRAMELAREPGTVVQ